MDYARAFPFHEKSGGVKSAISVSDEQCADLIGILRPSVVLGAIGKPDNAAAATCQLGVVVGKFPIF